MHPGNNKRKYLILFVFILYIPANLFSQNQINKNNYYFKLSLSFYSKPVTNKEWEILIYRKEFKYYIKSINFNHKNFNVILSFENYQKLLNKLIKLGIWRESKKIIKTSRREFYQISIQSKAQKNTFHFYKNNGEIHNQWKLDLIAREIMNLAILSKPDTL